MTGAAWSGATGGGDPPAAICEKRPADLEARLTELMLLVSMLQIKYYDYIKWSTQRTYLAYILLVHSY